MWQEINNSLQKQFTFSDFKSALYFVNNVAKLAEKINHHPNILLHDYNKVTIMLSTHDAENTITQKDYDMSKEIDVL